MNLVPPTPFFYFAVRQHRLLKEFHLLQHKNLFCPHAPLEATTINQLKLYKLNSELIRPHDKLLRALEDELNGYRDC